MCNDSSTVKVPVHPHSLRVTKIVSELNGILYKIYFIRTIKTGQFFYYWKLLQNSKFENFLDESKKNYLLTLYS